MGSICRRGAGAKREVRIRLRAVKGKRRKHLCVSVKTKRRLDRALREHLAPLSLSSLLLHMPARKHIVVPNDLDPLCSSIGKSLGSIGKVLSRNDNDELVKVGNVLDSRLHGELRVSFELKFEAN